MADNVSHKKGDTFRVHGRFTGGIFTNWTGRSQVRKDEDDSLLSELTFEWIDAAEGFFVAQILNTDNWPANKYVLFDVEITSPAGEVRSSEAVRILVRRDATYGPRSN